MGRHKSAISITLDNNVLDFFSGKGRSGKINHILQQYLRHNLGDETANWVDEISDRDRFQAGISAMQRAIGDKHPIIDALLALKELIQ